MIPSVGLPEMIIILAIALIIFGAGKLPEVGGAIGKTLKNFKKEIKTEEKPEEEVKLLK